jgi:hypothetical protein
MSHTPGPWHWDSDVVKGDPLYRARYRVTTIGKTITYVYHSSGDEQAKHDAILIACAPELLAALQQLLKDSESSDTPITLDGAAARTLARAVIAKAQGWQ